MTHAPRTSFKTKAGTELKILNLKGKEYLQVAERVLWFNEEHPEWSIETEFPMETNQMAKAKATVRDEKGRIRATSHKIETASGFPDFHEKAETGAIGRALALLGYGTQFTAGDLDEGERVVDSPRSFHLQEPAVVRIPQPLEPKEIKNPLPGPRPLPMASFPSYNKVQAASAATQGKMGYPSEKQIARLSAIVAKAGWTKSDLHYVLKEGYGVSSPQQIKTKFDYDEICNASAVGQSPQNIVRSIRGEQQAPDDRDISTTEMPEPVPFPTDDEIPF